MKAAIATMNLELTTKEYLTLLKAVYLADCVANAHAADSTDMDWDISHLRRKVFKQAPEAGFADLVKHDPGADDYTETDDLGEEMDSVYLNRHMENVFWRELASRLTERIMDKKFGAEMDGWNDDEYHRRREPIQQKVETELRANGIDNLFLLGDI